MFLHKYNKRRLPSEHRFGKQCLLFSLNSKECELNFFCCFSNFSFKHKGCVLFPSTGNTSQSGDNHGFVFLSEEHGPILRTCQSANKALCCPDGLWIWRREDRGWGSGLRRESQSALGHTGPGAPVEAEGIVE